MSFLYEFQEEMSPDFITSKFFGRRIKGQGPNNQKSLGKKSSLRTGLSKQHDCSVKKLLSGGHPSYVRNVNLFNI